LSAKRALDRFRDFHATVYQTLRKRAQDNSPGRLPATL
jgi:hypothetical protein